MDLYQTKKILPETTRAEIEKVIEMYEDEIKDIESDLKEAEIRLATETALKNALLPIKQNKAQLEAILAKFYEAKCELCDHRQKMDIRTMKFICGKHDTNGQEVILQW